MQLSVLMKGRIAAVIAMGALIMGFVAWPLVAPEDPMGAVYIGTVTIADAVILVLLSAIVGFAAYFLAWPYGREIGGLAVPAGLAIWAIRTGDMKNLVLLNQSVEQRQGIFATFTWEPVFWLILVFVGFAVVETAHWISSRQEPGEKIKVKNDSKSRMYMNSAFAVIASVIVARILIRILAQDFRLTDTMLASVIAQPAKAQIVFAVLVSFGVAAFLIKVLLNANYIWSIIAAALTTALMSFTCRRQDILQRLFDHYPLAFFSSAIASILPVQMIAFGTLGAIAGYWLAIRYGYWRKHGI